MLRICYYVVEINLLTYLLTCMARGITLRDASIEKQLGNVPLTIQVIASDKDFLKYVSTPKLTTNLTF